MVRKYIITMLRTILLLLTLLLLSCDSLEQNRLRIGTNIWPGNEVLYMAHSIHKDNDGIDFIEYRNASQVLNGLLNNHIDVASLTLDEAVRAAALGHNITIIWVLDWSAGADALLSQSTITSIDDLVGKRIAVETSALGIYFLERFLDSSELTKSQIEIVNLEVNRHYDHFTDGSVDAVITFEPVRSKLMREGALELFNSRQISGEIVDVLVINNNTMNINKQKRLSGLLTQHSEIVEQLKQNFDTYSSALNSRLNLSKKELADAFGLIEIPTLQQQKSFFSNQDKLNQLIKKYEKVLIENKLIDSQCKCSDLFSLKYIERSLSI